LDAESNKKATDTRDQSPGALDLSVVVITLNEAQNLPRLLKSLPPDIELIVVDSGSSDSTVEIARSHGARVEKRDFDNYAAQKNFALGLAARSWVLSVDADEELTPGLAERIADIVKATRSTDPANTVQGYFVCRNLVFMGRLMRFGKTSDNPLRLIRRGSGEFVAEIHERLQLSGGSSMRTGHIGGQGSGGTLNHYSYADLTDYFRRFNNYTSRVALNHFRQGKAPPPLVFHVLRPWWEFVSRYFFRLGFLDGYPGFCYALFSSVYTFVKYEKLRELLHQEPAL